MSDALDRLIGFYEATPEPSAEQKAFIAMADAMELDPPTEAEIEDLRRRYPGFDALMELANEADDGDIA